MRKNKLLIVLLVVALVFTLTLVGCGSKEPAGNSEKPAGNGEKPADQPKTYTAKLPENQPKVDMITPNLANKVKQGAITQEFMDETIEKVGAGELSIEELQKIMTGK
jgi:flagellar basal body-associated protein FliL